MTPSEHALDPQGDEKGAWDKPTHTDSARDTAAPAVGHSRSPSILAPASVSSIAVMHAPLLVVITASTEAPPPQVTLFIYREYEFACACGSICSCRIVFACLLIPLFRIC